MYDVLFKPPQGVGMTICHQAASTSVLNMAIWCSSLDSPYKKEFRAFQQSIINIHKSLIKLEDHWMSGVVSVGKPRIWQYITFAFPHLWLILPQRAWSQPISCWLRKASNVNWPTSSSSSWGIGPSQVMCCCPSIHGAIPLQKACITKWQVVRGPFTAVVNALQALCQ